MGIDTRMVPCITTLALALTMLHAATGFIAYDCADVKTNVTAVSLKDIKPCSPPETSYESQNVTVQVIQRNEFKTQKVWTCLIDISRIIFYCGMHSHTSIVDGGLDSYIEKLGTEECKNMHRYKTLQLYQKTIGNILMNGTTTSSITLHGNLDGNGACKGVEYQENGRTWKDVVVIASVKIQATDYLASVSLDDNEIHLKEGVTCPFIPGYCFDSSLGETTWDRYEPPTCENHLTHLYKGPGEKITNKQSKEEVVVFEQMTKLFALTLQKRAFICGIETWQTEHPRILINFVNLNQRIQPEMPLLPQNVDLMNYVNSKFLYIEQAYQRQLEKLYIDTVHRRCLTRREILKNRLLMAPSLPNAVSQLMQHTPGYTGRVLGEVLYIMQCIPKTVSIRRTNKCYHELPINISNHSKFMSPITRIIQDYAEEVDCNNLIPPLYFIDDQWIGLTPLPTKASTPIEFSVEGEELMNLVPLQPIGAEGLYTQQEIQEAQRILTFGTERKAVENIITRRTAGLPASGQGYKMTNLFNEDEIKDFAQSTIKHIWGWFSTLGTFMSGLIGFYITYKILQYVCEVTVNSLRIYQTVGCGFVVIASIWTSLTSWVLHQHERKEKCKEEMRLNIQNEEDAKQSTDEEKHWTTSQDVLGKNMDAES